MQKWPKNSAALGKSGNGTNRAQWLYVKVHLPFVWRWKIGITGNLLKRTRQTSADVWGRYVPVAFVHIWFAWSIEQFILNATKGFERSILGKGGREIRPWYIGLPAAVTVYALGVIKWTVPIWIAWAVVELGGG